VVPMIHLLYMASRVASFGGKNLLPQPSRWTLSPLAYLLLWTCSLCPHPQGHPHVTLAYLLVEAADVAGLQDELRIRIRERHQGGDSPPAVAAAAAAAAADPCWETTGPLMARFWLGRAGSRARDAAAGLLEGQRDNVVLVGSLGVMQAMLGKTTVSAREEGDG